MFRTVVFSPDGKYSGWKEYSNLPEKLDTNEVRISDRQWEDKESLILIDGRTYVSKQQTNKIANIHFSKLVNDLLDAQAIELGYDSTLTIVSFSDDDANPVWQAEAKAFKVWRSQVYNALHSIQNKITSGTGVIPEDYVFLSSIPKFTSK